MSQVRSPVVIRRIRAAAGILVTLSLGLSAPVWAGCPAGQSNPITSRDLSAVLFLSGLGAAPVGSFFLLGSGDQNNSGTLPSSAWLHNVGDVDGDGLPDYRVGANGEGPGGWGDPRTVGCPSTASPAHPPLVLVIYHLREDRDGDGKFDIFEDLNRNGQLDPGEDRDADGHVTPPGGCEGELREDQDCDGHLDFINEDDNGNGRLDPGEDRDADGHLDPGTEDRNHDFVLNDRPVVKTTDADSDENGIRGNFYPYEERVPAPGGILVISLAWNGSAYNLQGINTPTEVAGPNEDIDGDGAFDVFEDRNRNGQLDPGEDLDGDRRLTPPSGCEGIGREDDDCDGHLDFIDEDFNHNGQLDPGEDLDNDGHLDAGTEDRNHDQILNDRPLPHPDDVIYEYLPDGSVQLVAPTYPYGEFAPAHSFRIVRALPLAMATPEVTGVHSDPAGRLRLRFDVQGLDLTDDLLGTRPIFDRLLLELSAGDCCGDPALAPRFVESGLPRATLPAAGNLAAHGPLSVLTAAGSGLSAALSRSVGGLSDGSDLFLTMPGRQPSLTPTSILDEDGDGSLLPLDNCIGLSNADQADSNADGIGDLCDPSHTAGAIVPDLWAPAGDGSTPGPRNGAASAYDAARGVVVLFGGADDPGTWEFDGATWWRFTTPVAPDARRDHRMAYDSIRRRMVIYGGTRVPDGVLLADQWEYDGAAHTWTRVNLTVTPGPRAGFGLAYDSHSASLVLFGGTATGRLLSDTWVYHGGSWRPVPTPQSPSARDQARMTWDGFHQVVVLQGGALHNDLWEFDGVTWQPVDFRGNIVPGQGGAIDFDPARRQIVLFGGTALMTMPGFGIAPSLSAATWLYDGIGWEALPTRDTASRRAGHAGAFDARRGVLVIQGGAGVSGAGLIDTVELRRADDQDGDGILNAADNCPNLANAAQADSDADGSGDACDNCPGLFNPTQRDLDRDRVGDACDPDIDGDGIANAADACPMAYVAGRPLALLMSGGGPDTDGDGVADDCDRCPHDPANDADHDGLCGDADNCPNSVNPMQVDTNGDGAGDACQPVVHIVSIDSLPQRSLNARVTISDPDGDSLSGAIEVLPTVVLPDALTVGGDLCAAAFQPDGVAGEGILFVGGADGAAPYLADADSNVGCVDGLPDFAFTSGTCAASAGQEPVASLMLGGTAPFAICVHRAGGGAGAFDYVVQQSVPGALYLSGGTPPLLSVPFDRSHLPRLIDLKGLRSFGLYALRIRATDGATPEASDTRAFTWRGERALFLNLHGRHSTSLVLPTIHLEGSAPLTARVR